MCTENPKYAKDFAKSFLHVSSCVPRSPAGQASCTPVHGRGDAGQRPPTPTLVAPTPYGGSAIVPGVSRGGKKIRWCLQGTMESLVPLSPPRARGRGKAVCLLRDCSVWGSDFSLFRGLKCIQVAVTQVLVLAGTRAAALNEPTILDLVDFKFSWRKIINKPT